MICKARPPSKTDRIMLKARKQRRAKSDFVDFLAKIGNKAAQEERTDNLMFDLEAVLTRATKINIGAFGKPDSMVINPSVMEKHKKPLKSEIK